MGSDRFDVLIPTLSAGRFFHDQLADNTFVEVSPNRDMIVAATIDR